MEEGFDFGTWKWYTNENIAIGLLKDSMIQIFLERSRRKREKLILILQQEIEMYLLPIRKMPCHERKKNFSNKYKNNQKSSFWDWKMPISSKGISMGIFKKIFLILEKYIELN